MNYKLMVTVDVVKFLEENPLARGLSHEDLYNLLYDEPSVVDVGDSIDSDKLRTMIIENFDLVLDTCDDYFKKLKKSQEKDWKWFDKSIRRYLLQEVVSYVLQKLSAY